MIHARRGFTLLEVMLALAILTVGAMVGLTVLAGTAQRNEHQKFVAIGTKASQDVIEALLSMSYSDLQSLYDYQQGPPATTLTFDVTAPGFIRQPGGGYVKGTYTIADISDQFGWSAGSKKVFGLDVRIDYQTIHIRLETRRSAP
jgi:prepilin-type N-terminal cleavage/methylation domain-containing protein